VSAKRVSVRQTGPNSFAVVGADGAIVRDNFPIPAVAWMRAAKRGLHQGAAKRKREARAIPSNLEDEQILGLPVLARLSNTSYPVFLERAKAGEYGPLFQIGKRTFGLRLGDWKKSIAAREVQTK
jgi:hypothetical protein